MTDPSPLPEAGDRMTVVRGAVGGIGVEPAEKREIRRFTDEIVIDAVAKKEIAAIEDPFVFNPAGRVLPVVRDA
jgi:hypothetical protein